MKRRDFLQAIGGVSAFASSNGLVQLSENPGFGIELDPAKIEKQEIMKESA